MGKKASIRFTNKNRSQFFNALKTNVDEYFTTNNISKNGNATMVVKSIVLLSGYFVPYLIMLFFPMPLYLMLLSYVLMGLSMAGIGMSVMHDANHNAYSANQTVNRFMGYTLNFAGGNVFNWKLQHNILHHTYTNIHEMDDDIDSKLILRLSPHGEVKSYHRFQFIYAFFLYGITTLYWVLLKDFVQFFKYTRNGVNRASKEEKRKQFTILIVSKLLYYFYMFVIPCVFFEVPFLKLLAGFLLMHAVSGVILTTIFQLAHTVEGTTHPLPNEKSEVENEWAIHQMNTTVNFCRSNRWISWYVGGLNFQVEHHLFPNICHVHYYDISLIVKRTAEEHGIPYLENLTFKEALDSHVRLLKKLGNPAAEDMKLEEAA
jgi:linoleoyl-CoA desaturase